jgi:hypothetical protein
LEQPKTLRGINNQLGSVHFPSVKELHFLIACQKSNDCYVVKLIEEILDKCPAVESIRLYIIFVCIILCNLCINFNVIYTFFRLETSDVKIKIDQILMAIYSKGLKNLSSIDLGQSCLHFEKVELCTRRTTSALKSFSWEGNIPEDVKDISAYDEIFSENFIKGLETLRITGLTRHPFPNAQLPLKRYV